MRKHSHMSDDRYVKMTSLQLFCSRLIIVLGMVMAVVAVVYFTPVPDTTYGDCDRPCKVRDWPMICRFKLFIESHPSSHQTCESNCSFSYHSEDLIFTNRAFPGPPMHVCQNDVLVVDVINKMPGHSLAVHWRGQPNNEVPFMDGVPLVTQCPISSFNTFQYKFRASAAGTHFYHAHSHQDWSQGLQGALIVRQSDLLEPHRGLYEIDAREHVILISESSEKNLLINGRSPEAKEMFNVEKGKRYRFRVIYSGGFDDCPIGLTIDKHLVRVIALDGNPVKAYESASINLSKGERIDFVLNTNQIPGRYYLKAKSNCGSHGIASINYQDSKKILVEDGVEETTIKVQRNFDTLPCNSEIGKVCLGDVKSVEKMPQLLRKAKLDKTLFLSLSSKLLKNNGLTTHVWSINNLTFSYPSSPLLSQLQEVSINSVCDELNVPEKCVGEDICECVHVEYIPKGASVELILIDEDGAEAEHVFHLHGYKFYLISARNFDEAPKRRDVERLYRNDELFRRKNLEKPVLKDTVRVPRNGVVALRFIADNPGFWMLRDEKSKDWTRGMDLVLQVGDVDQMVSSPPNFPTCGNYIGPEFFLV